MFPSHDHDEYAEWDGVTYADAQCHECVRLEQEDEEEDCDTCGDTGKWESTFEEAPTVLANLGPCPECNKQEDEDE